MFAWLQRTGGVADHELRRTFNCGVGFLLVVDPEHLDAVLSCLLKAGEAPFVCGELAAGCEKGSPSPLAGEGVAVGDG